MAQAPLNHLTAKVGDTFLSGDGKTFKRVLSPYANDGKTTMDVLQGPAPAAAPHAPAVAIPAAQPAAQVEAVASDPATAPVAAPAAPAPGPEPVEAPVPADNSLEAEHLADMAARQTQADQNDRDIEDMHTALAAQPPPSQAPEPVPTVAPQPQKLVEANLIPTPVLKDVARGMMEAPDMALSGAHAAVRNLLTFSDHIADLVDEHVPLSVAWRPDGKGGTEFAHGSNADLVKQGFPDASMHSWLDHFAPPSPIDDPKSVTGGVIKSVAQFSTGFALGGSVLKGWKAAAGAGAVVKGMAQGALSDFGAFDAHQARFSDYLKKVAPDAIKPVFDYLSSDPRDGEAEGRFKNALEGLGLGAAMHGVMVAARSLRAARMVQRAAAISAQNEGLQGLVDGSHDTVVAEAEKFAVDLSKDVGEVGRKGFTIKRKFPLTPGEVAATADAEEMGPNTIGLNYSKISDGADLQAASVQLYDAFHGELTDAKRGVQSIDKQITDAFGADVSQLLSGWKPGTAMLSHELTALRFAQAAAVRDLVAHARAIAAGDSSLAKQAAFLQIGGIADALSRAVEGGKAEAARTLRTLRETVPTMTGDKLSAADAVSFYRKVDALVAGAGGRDMVEKAAKAFLTVAQANPLGTSRFLRGLAWVTKFNNGSKEIIKVFMTNGLLTAGGITKNVFGNTSALVWERMMRGLAPKLYGMVGAQSHIADREAIASQASVMSAFQDVFRLREHINAGFDPTKPWTAIKKQGQLLADNFDDAKAKTKGFTSAHREEVKAADPGTGLGLAGVEQGPDKDSPLGRVASFVYKAAKIPGQTHGVLDDFSNIISGRAELASQAYRAASKDAEAGLISADQVGERMQKYMEDPDEAMLGRVVDAQQNTSWTRPPDTSQAFMTNGVKAMRTGMDNLPIPFPLGTSVFPYINTPANIFSYGIQNSVFAPLSSRFREAVMSTDGATRQLALTKYSVGSLISMWVMNHVANGDITGGGPRDPAQRQALMRTDPDTHATIFQPYSVRINDRWVQLSGAEPFATNIDLAADMSEAWLGNDWDDNRVQTATDAFSATAMSFGNAFLDKSTMQGASQLMDAMAAYKRGDVSAPDKFIENRVVAAIPFSSALKTARRQTDPYQREVGGVVDKFKDSVPGLSSSLPLSFDLWGRKRTYDTGMGTAYDNVIPARSHPIGAEPADREMLRLGYAKTMPPKSISLPGGRVADLRNYPTIYNEILTRGGPPALAEINDLVSGGAPNSGFYDGLADSSDQNAPGTKSRYLARRLEYHFKQATASVRRDFADELGHIADEQAARRAAARAGP